MARRLELNSLRCVISLCVQVCLHSFANLSRIPDKHIMEEDQEVVEESLTHKLMSPVDAT